MNRGSLAHALIEKGLGPVDAAANLHLDLEEEGLPSVVEPFDLLRVRSSLCSLHHTCTWDQTCTSNIHPVLTAAGISRGAFQMKMYQLLAFTKP